MLDQLCLKLMIPPQDQAQHSPRNETIPNIVPIKLDLAATSANNPLMELMFRKRGAIYYELVCDKEHKLGKKYILRDKTSGEFQVPDGAYIFVVIADELGILSLRIGRGNHYFLAEKRDSVFAAGEIKFERRDDENTAHILSINDKSGAYHNKELKRESFMQVLKYVDLPAELFIPYKGLDEALSKIRAKKN